MPATIQVVDGRTVIQAGENTAEASRQAAIAVAAREAARAAADTAQAALAGTVAIGNYRPTRAQGVADFAVGEFFTSDETGALRAYRRITAAPGYEDMGDSAAPLSRPVGLNRANHTGTQPMASVDGLLTSFDKAVPGFNLIATIPEAGRAGVLAGTSTTNYRAEIQAALDLYKDVFLPAGAQVCIDGELIAQNGAKITGNGSTIKQLGSQKTIFNQQNKLGFTVDGVNFVGKRTDYANGSSSRATAAMIAGAKNVRFENCTFTHFAYSSVSAVGNIRGCDGFVMRNCTVIGPGLIADGGCLVKHGSGGTGGTKDNTALTVGGRNITIDGLTSSRTATGLIVMGGSQNVNVRNLNVMNTLVEHGVYLDTGLRNVAFVDFVIQNTEFIGMKLQWHEGYTFPANYDDLASPLVDTPPSDCKFSNGTIKNTGGQGISTNNITAAAITKASRVSVVNVSFSACAGGSIDARYVRDGLFSANTISASGENAILVAGLTRCKISDNIVNGATQSGFMGSSIALCVDCEVSGNKFFSCGSDTAASDYMRAGITVLGGTGWSIHHNQAVGKDFTPAGDTYDPTKRTQYGLAWVDGSNRDTNAIYDNQFSDALYGARWWNGSSAFKRISDNSLSGSSLAIHSGKPDNYPPATFWVSALPVAGPLVVGDRYRIIAPAAGQPAEYIATTTAVAGLKIVSTVAA